MLRYKISRAQRHYYYSPVVQWSSISDSESGDPGSNPGGTIFLRFEALDLCKDLYQQKLVPARFLR